ncbi:hypothetical protein [Nocardia sp. NPDC058666]|uniref:hypothetical protein n=1 Tax=unclassified Nocardia TaxID=2637762 RepID=UPI003668A038
MGPGVAASNLLPDRSTGHHRRFDADEVADFLANYPYRPDRPVAYLGVSLGPLAERVEPVYDLSTLPPVLFSRYAGYDYLNVAGLTPTERARAIVCTWNISEATAKAVIERKLPLMGCVKGVTTHDTIFWPRDMIRLTGGIGFVVDPDLRGHDEIGTGVITTVPGGGPWRIVDPAGL